MVANPATASSRITIVGGGPCGMTSALLLARAGHKVTLLEGGAELGGLWATTMSDGNYQCENSCKVYQENYHTTPPLFAMIGVDWKDHFYTRHDLQSEWLSPFLADSSAKDIAKIAWAFAVFMSGARDYKDLSVEDWLNKNRVSESCQSWLRATALGGITGTLKMTTWEMMHRFSGNLMAMSVQEEDALYWNRQPPNANSGFIPIWERSLKAMDIEIHVNARVKGVSKNADALCVALTDDRNFTTDNVFLALPPPALSKVLDGSDDDIAEGFGHSRASLKTVLTESKYEHLGIAWFFDTPIQNDLPLGGHNVREGWYPILVQHSQYEPYLKDAITTVVGSVSLDTDFVHPIHKTMASEHSPDELAQILWEDEQRKDPSLPNPIRFEVYGCSAASQIVQHGALPVKSEGAPVFIATNLNGLAPYFTSSLETAIQAGNATACVFDPSVERLPTAPEKAPKRRASLLRRGLRLALRTVPLFGSKITIRKAREHRLRPIAGASGNFPPGPDQS